MILLNVYVYVFYIFLLINIYDQLMINLVEVCYFYKLNL